VLTVGGKKSLLSEVIPDVSWCDLIYSVLNIRRPTRV